MTSRPTVTRAAADIGGTFTDVAVLTPDGRLATRKLPSTPDNYADAVIAGVRGLLEEIGSPLDALEELLHGCTVATNAILEGKGAPTALVTTRGFRDVLELRRVRVPNLYEPLYERPPPLVPRQFRFEVDERTGPRGEELRRSRRSWTCAPRRSASAPPASRRLRSATCTPTPTPTMNGAPARYCATMLPGVIHFALRGRAAPEAGVRAHLHHRHQRLRRPAGESTTCVPWSRRSSDAGIGGRLMVMQSSGGILDADAVAENPARIVECGPAAGVIGARHFAARAGFDNVITLDMGGTTAKASLIEGGRITFADEYEVGGGMSSRSALMGGGGYALKLPVIDISEVGAGGGSIAWLDKAGSLKVGPQSAGAVPGPACYDTGNDEPTVTDANVVLGYLNPESLAGRSVPIRSERAHEAIATRLANPLRRDVVETAFGVHTVANANMMKAVKAVTTYRGRDPRDFTLIAFGGSGGVHAVDLARVLQVRRVVLPVAAGVFSALGLLFSNLEMNETVPFLYLAEDAPLDEAERRYGALAKRIAAVVGGPHEEIRFARLADVRFAGQAYELTVPFGEVSGAGVDEGRDEHKGDGSGPISRDAVNAKLDTRAVADLCARFEAEHLARYGHAFSGEFPVEIVNLRLVGTRRPAGIVEPASFDAASRQGPDTRRGLYFGPATGLVDSPVIGRGRLGAEPRTGPFVIEEYEGTCVVPPDCTARLDGLGNVIIELPAVHAVSER